jgi:Tol biopolymer transport system component
VWVDRQGRVEAFPTDVNNYGTPRLSPDGRRLAVEILNDIWLYDLQRRTWSRVTRRGINQYPVWTPDGRHVAFSSSQGVQEPKLAWIDVDQGGDAVPLTREGDAQFPSSWSPDGSALAYAEAASSEKDKGTGFDVWLLKRGAGSAREVVVRSESKEDQAVFSPDGAALAYVSDETGRLEVYLRRYPAGGRPVPVSADGGTEPVWSPKGDELFFRRGPQYLAAPVTTKGALSAGRPVVLFEGRFTITSEMPGVASYDVTPDGKRFVMVARGGDAPWPSRLDIVLNWVEKLKAALPARRR